MEHRKMCRFPFNRLPWLSRLGKVRGTPRKCPSNLWSVGSVTVLFPARLCASAKKGLRMIHTPALFLPALRFSVDA